MKNKLKKTMTALCAALILMGGFSVPAYAQGAATEPPAGDATNDSNVVVYKNSYDQGKYFQRPTSAYTVIYDYYVYYSQRRQ